MIWYPSPGAVVPASRLRRRYADAPATALLTGLGVGEWSCSFLPVGARPYAAIPCGGDNRRGVERSRLSFTPCLTTSRDVSRQPPTANLLSRSTMPWSATHAPAFPALRAASSAIAQKVI